jgi:tetratricopeptide (TPR) repeat protein
MIVAQLQTLEISGLIQLASARPELEYVFRHALLQEAVYNSLLKNDQKALHLAAGEVLESLYVGRVEQIAAHLAYHFSNAEDHQRAVKYYRLAGDLAVERYATPEALELYTRAVELAEVSGQSTPELYQARGTVKEILGDFEGSCADQSQALSLAEKQNNVVAKWQSLSNLGMLWASRDYHQTGEFYQQALDLARSWDAPDYLARSLNRMGNWYMNVDEPYEAIKYHQEALSIFTIRQDRQEIANTLDLLGISHGIGADAPKSFEYLSKAVQAYREMDDLKGLASSLATISIICAPVAESEVVITNSLSVPQAIQHAREALGITRQINWRSGEAFSLACLAQGLEANGQLDAALEASGSAQRIAAEIKHSQWLTAGKIVAGLAYTTLYDYDRAVETLQSAFELANTIGSINWVHEAAGILGHVLVIVGQIENAEAVLDAALKTDNRPRTLGERMIWIVRSELALAHGDFQTALQIVDQMYQDLPLRKEGYTAPRLSLVLARAQVLLGREDEALVELKAMRRSMQDLDARTMLWHCHTALYQLYQRLHRQQEANEEQGAALTLITELASTLKDDTQRAHFTERATAELTQADYFSSLILGGGKAR